MSLALKVSTRSRVTAHQEIEGELFQLRMAESLPPEIDRLPVTQRPSTIMHKITLGRER